MKKVLLAVTLMLTALTANAQHHHGHYHGGNSGWWIGPAIIGGVIGYALAQPRYEPPPVIVQPQPVYAPPPVCPYPYLPRYERTWVMDAYGRYVPVDQFVGCR